MRGAQIQRHDHGESVQQQIVDDTNDGADKNLAIGDENGRPFGKFLQPLLTTQPPNAANRPYTVTSSDAWEELNPWSTMNLERKVSSKPSPVMKMATARKPSISVLGTPKRSSMRIMSGTDLDDGLGNACDLAVEEVLHLLEFKLVADQTADIHLASGHQRNGIAEGERVDEGALNGQLLLIDVVRVHLEMRLLRPDMVDQHEIPKCLE